MLQTKIPRYIHSCNDFFVKLKSLCMMVQYALNSFTDLSAPKTKPRKIDEKNCEIKVAMHCNVSMDLGDFNVALEQKSLPT